MAAKSPGSKDSSANLGFEAKLWLSADKLRNNMDAAEYKHVVLGLIFLKYISDSFDEHQAKLVAGIQHADIASRSKDLLGRVFVYFLTQFAKAEGKNGGQFYTPFCVVRLLVEMLAPLQRPHRRSRVRFGRHGFLLGVFGP